MYPQQYGRIGPPGLSRMTSQHVMWEPPEIHIPGSFGPSTSPLLTLPSEIRNIIWALVLGNRGIRGIHISRRADHCNPNFSAELCESDVSPETSHEISLDNDPDLKYFSIKSAFSSEYADMTNFRCITEHFDCGPSLSLDPHVMQVCRQIYAEAGSILYSKNTFYFEEPISFRNFFRRIGPTHRKSIRTISIQIECTDRWEIDGEYPTYPLNPGEPNRGFWRAALNLNLITQLTGLKTLHIQINTDFRHTTNYGLAERLGRSSETALYHFRELPLLETITVILTTADFCDKLPLKWPLLRRQRFAKKLRAYLLKESVGFEYSDI